jgi:hypothetical protein
VENEKPPVQKMLSLGLILELRSLYAQVDYPLPTIHSEIGHLPRRAFYDQIARCRQYG